MVRQIKLLLLLLLMLTGGFLGKGLSACTFFSGRYSVGTLSGLSFTLNPFPEKKPSRGPIDTENTHPYFMPIDAKCLRIIMEILWYTWMHMN